MTRNGQPVPHSEQGTSRASPSDITEAVSFMVSAETTQEFPSFTITGTSFMSGVWEVQPEAGESEGDPVCYQYSHVAEISAESSGQATAGVIIGGGDLSADAQADEDAGTFSYDVNVAGAGGIDVEGVNVLSFGPTEIASGEAADFSDSGTFLTAIGESFSLQGSMAAAGAGVHPGSAVVQAASEFNIAETELADCFPAVDLSPNPVNFNDQEVGMNSDPLSVTLENTGHADLDVGSITSPTAPFAAAGGTCGNAPFTLTPGATCTLDYSFSPTTTGAASQSITLDSNALDAPHQLELQGNGTQAETVLSLGDVDFGEHAFGTSSETRSIAISNGGDADLVIDGIDNPEPPFEITGGSCHPLPATITPGESCTIEARMTPTSWSGSFTGEILIFSNSPSSPDRVGLRGTSPAPLPVPTLGLPAAVLLILSILAITRRSNRQHASG
ncbi:MULTISPECIES: choice-of-anchor D domain-containing protein [unclassified Wenzhouxiangella]|uniref:choice-of-anchor D domain-containing protein n=1 Tax=unclassified Wenzhouxiangella TaxID=2613841 RepID=UPI0015F27521|nr:MULTISPECIES: choice-of-anchor D domain-containing protein [unclassified Wenzhouxiangella]